MSPPPLRLVLPREFEIEVQLNVIRYERLKISTAEVACTPPPTPIPIASASRSAADRSESRPLARRELSRRTGWEVAELHRPELDTHKSFDSELKR